MVSDLAHRYFQQNLHESEVSWAHLVETQTPLLRKKMLPRKQ